MSRPRTVISSRSRVSGSHVQGLTPGNYDLAVFAWSLERAGFVAPRTVRVTVRP